MKYLLIISIIYLNMCGMIQATYFYDPYTQSFYFYSDTGSNLVYFGNGFYGYPSGETGENVAESSQQQNRLYNPKKVDKSAKGDTPLTTALKKSEPTNRRRRWPGEQIPYYIAGDFTPDQRNMIYMAMNEFEIYTCIRFIPWNGQRDYIRITSEKEGCTSKAIGYIRNVHIVNFEPDCFSGIGTLMHELMHALGFEHEQNRYDRDQYVDIDESNILPEYKHNFEKIPENELQTFGPYDYYSLMHYPSGAFSKNNKDTIIPKAQLPYPFGQRTGFSEIDINKINKKYNCKNQRELTMPNNYMNNQGYDYVNYYYNY